MSDEGLKHLREFPALVKLRIAGSDIGDAGVGQLMQLAGLRDCTLDCTRATAAGTDRLRAALPKCLVESSWIFGNEDSRRNAEWVLSLGGRVRVQWGNTHLATADTAADLPGGVFHVAEVDFAGNQRLADEDLGRSFEPFEGRSGTGLGLAIARGFAEANGARLWAEPRHGSGASFVVALPAAPWPVTVGG